MNKTLLLYFVFVFSSAASADAIDMRDYIMLKKGMSEAEVLYRFGPYDHETIRSDTYNYVLEKTWYYIPANGSTNDWITEIRFNSKGKIVDLERYKVK